MNRRGFLATALLAMGSLPFVKSEVALKLVQQKSKESLPYKMLVVQEVTAGHKGLLIKAAEPTRPGYTSTYQFRIDPSFNLEPGDVVRLSFDREQDETWGLSLHQATQQVSGFDPIFYHRRVFIDYSRGRKDTGRAAGGVLDRKRRRCDEGVSEC